MTRRETLLPNVYRTIHRFESPDGGSLCGLVDRDNSRPYTGSAMTGRECRVRDRGHPNRFCGGRLVR